MSPAWTQAQEGRDRSVRELGAFLSEEVETAPFREKRTLKKSLELLAQIYKGKGKELPFQFDHKAFKEENPEADDPLETQVVLPDRPRAMRGSQLLQAVVEQIPTGNGALWIVPGAVKITTRERVSLPFLLGQQVEVALARRPLHLALDDLFEQTGVAVLLDPRVGIRARTPVTMNPARQISLGTTLLLLSEISGLKLIMIDDTILITTPELARQLVIERLTNPYWLPSWKRAPHMRDGA